MSDVSETAAGPQLLLLTTLHLHRLPPPLPPPASTSSCLLTRCQPLYASCCTVLVHCKINSVFFAFVFFMYYLCKKNYQPVPARYYIADSVSWVPRLTVLDSLGLELIRM